jgi:aldose sugar dehydrogenase
MHHHYAYGIRDSLGASTDPITGSLWNKENGDKGYNEINIVNPGFNIGWKKI